MANIRAAQNGNFSATSTWVGGVVPGSGDVAYANTFTVTISDTRTVQAISNDSGTGITAGGTFSILGGCNLACTNANGIVHHAANVSNCVTVDSLTIGQSALITANITVTGSGSGRPVLVFSSNGTLNFVGNLTGTIFGINSDNTPPISVTGSGTLNVTGNLLGANSADGPAINVTSSSVINITGSVTGGISSTSTSPGLYTSGNSNITITGNVLGASTGLSAGINNSGIGTVTVNGSCQSGSKAPGIALGSLTQITRLSGPFLLGASGNINPVQAASWRWAPTQIPTYMEVPTSGGSTKRNLYTADNMPTGGYPVAANVRQSTVYGPSSEFTGTLAVPSPSSVALGVATDNTVGTAILTAASVRAAMGLASANMDTQFSGIPAAVWAAATRTLTTAIPTAADIASAVWSAAVRTITGGTVDTLTNSPNVPSAATIASAVWSAVTRTITGGTVDTLTNAPTVPSAAAIASTVRTELITELACLDAPVTTRLAAANYTAPTTPPTTTAIAAQVRTELSPELARVANCSTVDTTATTIRDAVSG